MNNHFANTYPALEGNVVTEGHARICRENGHATNTILGENAEPVEISERCPRCGDLLAAADLRLMIATETAEGHVDILRLGALDRAWKVAVKREKDVVEVAAIRATRAEREAAEDFEGKSVLELRDLLSATSPKTEPERHVSLREAWKVAVRREERRAFEAAEKADAELTYIPSPGDAVTNNEDRFGIVTEFVRKSGPNKGRIAVMWIGENGPLTERPSAVTVIPKHDVAAFVAVLRLP